MVDDFWLTAGRCIGAISPIAAGAMASDSNVEDVG